MNTEDLKTLADRATTIEGRRSERLTDVHDRIHTARRRRATAAAVSVAGLALMVTVLIGATAWVDSSERQQEPILTPTSPGPTPTQTVAVPAVQTTITPDVAPGDIRGWETLATRTNTEPGFLGATDLTLTVTVHDDVGDRSYVDWFCHGDSHTFISMAYGNGGGGLTPCSVDDPTAPGPPREDIAPGPIRPAQAEVLPVRLFVFKPTKAQEDCIRGTGVADCTGVLESIRPLASTTAIFGFAVYQRPANRAVMNLFDVDFEALAMVDGREYVTEKAVVAASAAQRLNVALDPSTSERVVGVFTEQTPAGKACYDSYAKSHNVDTETRDWLPAADKECGVKYALKVDGEWHDPLPPGAVNSSWGDPWMVAPGGAREVSVAVTRGDPRNERFALVIWKAPS